MIITPAASADLQDCQAIYAYHVLNGTGTFEETPPSLEELTSRYQTITQAGWGWLVARDAAGVLGFGYYAQLRNRSAYRFAAEDSIYIRDTVRGQGVGKAIVAALLTHAASQGFTQMLAVIGDSENTGSIGLHASLGFTQVGTMRKVGFKFNRWLDVVTMQKALG
ncbi:MAG: GNAT family N-acetyltransferase [Acidocella sp. 20-57-95]|nr:MAG: GNAT family N-acetyltransferase [Acidocella sp. 20-57-95]OYV59582.1 MAG: GNAT family N-acetyltransferase [Acidocella sp. 21-58-7]HQT63597.1 N-acetyltransferase family protein [Acidocella sp.]HQU04902.1 N-acetyltransferase family protein [Acidocella sp.]